MDLSADASQFLDATRRDGWTPPLEARFLALLSENGNVRLAARRCGPHCPRARTSPRQFGVDFASTLPQWPAPVASAAIRPRQSVPRNASVA